MRHPDPSVGTARLKRVAPACRSASPVAAPGTAPATVTTAPRATNGRMTARAGYGRPARIAGSGPAGGAVAATSALANSARPAVTSKPTWSTRVGDS
ncbi:hypothetical protein GCM10010103_09520 [Streptomyces paradoxus]